jgi:ADP-ribosyl-[dinitrogen reductase] hydrolase
MMTRRGLTHQQEQPSSHSSSNNNNNSSLQVTQQQQQHLQHQQPTTERHRSHRRKQHYPFASLQRIISSRSFLSACMIFGTASLFMGLFALFSQKNNNTNNKSNSSNIPLSLQQSQSTTTASRTMKTMMIMSSPNTALKESRLRAALWSFFAGDALAMPSHWYYGGAVQIQRDYGGTGGRGITDYTAPVHFLSGSILNKSNLSGGGRSTSATPNRRTVANAAAAALPLSIIGYVINHGKQDLWSPDQEIHYHATLAAGENTLEVQLARVLMRSITATAGVFDAAHFLSSYVTFMMTPGSHNDTYASTCHRMFFANKIFQGRADKDCPDNDGHNVDTIDGLVLPTITALAVAARGSASDNGSTGAGSSMDDLMQRAAQAAMATASVTRRSNILENAAAAWSRTVVAALLAPSETNTNTDNNNNNMMDNMNMEAVLQDTARAIGMRRAPAKTGADQMTACYLDSAMPALLDSVAKYIPDGHDSSSSNMKKANKAVSVWTALLNNANAGGENVHRGSCLGAVLGARAGMEGLAPELVSGLHDREALAQEIDDFVAAVLKA